MDQETSIACRSQVSFGYEVFFTERIFDPHNSVLTSVLSSDHKSASEKCLVFVEEKVVASRAKLPGQIAQYFFVHNTLPKLSSPPFVLAGGEAAKNDAFTVDQVHRMISEHRLSRHSYVIAIGGGAFLDAVGFAAATAHRGIRHLRVPTTTLSQADGGVGVKNGLNAFSQKNFLGTFAPPFAVINDFQFLDSLPNETKQAGYIEAVKVALIRDARFFRQIELDAEALNEFQPAAMQRLIRRCAELHIAQIATGGDPFEFGTARPLDFGHWSAHKLEQLSGFTMPHAKAVAVGIALDVLYSRNAGYLSEASAERILALLTSLRFRIFTPALLAARPNGKLALLEGLDEFREHLGGELTITLLSEIGEGFEIHEMKTHSIGAALDELQRRDAGTERP